MGSFGIFFPENLSDLTQPLQLCKLSFVISKKCSQKIYIIRKVLKIVYNVAWIIKWTMHLDQFFFNLENFKLLFWFKYWLKKYFLRCFNLFSLIILSTYQPVMLFSSTLAVLVYLKSISLQKLFVYNIIFAVCLDYFSNLISSFLEIVLRVTTRIAIIVTFLFHNNFSSLTKFWFLAFRLLLLSLCGPINWQNSPDVKFFFFYLIAVSFSGLDFVICSCLIVSGNLMSHFYVVFKWSYKYIHAIFNTFNIFFSWHILFVYVISQT